MISARKPRPRSTATKNSNLEWALDLATAHKLRRTTALEKILSLLLEHSQPITWRMICQNPSIQKECDPATVFRILGRMEKIGLVRRLGFHDRRAHYILALPKIHRDYLICTECGDIQNLDIHCPVHALEAQVSQQSGFQNIHHELEFYGICPACQN